MPKAKAPEPPEIVVVDGVSYEVRTKQWQDIGIGSTIRDRNGRRWTCFAAAQPQQFEYGKTCWLKFRAPNGQEITIPPRYVNFRVNMLVDPTAPRIEPAWAEGAEEAWLLAQELGAVEIATQDKRTGEVWCPDYTAPNGERTGSWPEIHHLEICHGVDVTALSEQYKADWNAGMLAVMAAHDAAHKHPVGGAGFTHRHMPEDHTIL